MYNYAIFQILLYIFAIKILFLKKVAFTNTVFGDVLTQEYVQKIRDDILAKKEKLKIAPQRGAQEKMLSVDADIKIVGGSRGGSKSFSMLLEGLKDALTKNFTAIILRNEKDDLQGIINDSYKIYSQYGSYNKSQNDMTWNFNSGGWLKLSYYAGAYEDFKTRFQGRQYAFIGIDEITQCPYSKFKYLLTNNRNASGIRNRFWGTCNPDPDSWTRKFIDWWIDDDGYAIPERDGVVRYCFMDGNDPNSIFWGSSREDVYRQCQGIIDELWTDDYERLGYNKLDMFVKSVTFIRADLSENILLTSTDKSYFGNLAQQDEEQRMRDLKANWNYKAVGDEMITETDIDNAFDNAFQLDDEKLYASADIALCGGDNLVLWLWEGFHVKDLFVCRLDSKTAVECIAAKLTEWGVEENNFTYDAQGIGTYIEGFFHDALPFVSQAAPMAMKRGDEQGVKNLYKDLKSQCAWLLYRKFKDNTISFNPQLLQNKYSGNGFQGMTLAQVLKKERKFLRRDEIYEGKGFKLLPKKMAKRYVGHSPDFFEALLYRMIFTLTNRKHKKIKGLWRF